MSLNFDDYLSIYIYFGSLFTTIFINLLIISLHVNTLMIIYFFSLLIIQLLSYYILFKLYNLWSWHNISHNYIYNDITYQNIDYQQFSNNNTIPIKNITVGSWNGKRNYMEDRNFIVHKHNIFGVVDGHSGYQIADFISKNFSTFFTINKTLSKTIIEIEKITDILSYNSGAVLSIIKFYDDYLEIASVGDTYVLFIYDNGDIKLINDTHSFNNFNEYRRYQLKNTITKKTVLRTKTGLMPTRTIGDHRHKKKDKALLFEPSIKKIYYNNIQNCKYIINCSDGIFDGCSYYQISNLIMTSNNLTTTIKNIQMLTTKHKRNVCDKIFDNFYGDNCTIMILQLK